MTKLKSILSKEFKIGSLISATIPYHENDIGIILVTLKTWSLFGFDTKVYWMISHKIFWHSRASLKELNEVS